VASRLASEAAAAGECSAALSTAVLALRLVPAADRIDAAWPEDPPPEPEAPAAPAAPRKPVAPGSAAAPPPAVGAARAPAEPIGEGEWRWLCLAEVR
jgi:hypothetical protein